MRRSLLVTVTNYLGSTQFYLTRTHQKIGLTIITPTLMSLLVAGGTLVCLGKVHGQQMVIEPGGRFLGHRDEIAAQGHDDYSQLEPTSV